MPQLEGSLVIIWYLSPLVDENTAVDLQAYPGCRSCCRQGWERSTEPSQLRAQAPSCSDFPLGAAASPAGHQLWESYLFHACYSKWSWLNSETNVCYSPSSAGEIDKDTQGPKGLISWNSEMKARVSLFVPFPVVTCENGMFFLWHLGSIKTQQPEGEV